jgi:hypothetical protein
MRIDIDGFAVLRGIGAHRAAFPDLGAEAAKTARALVTRQIAAKATGLKSLRDIRSAIGDDAFALILDGLTDAQIASLVTKLDKNHPERASAKPDWRRRHVAALVNGSVEPAAKAAGKMTKEPKPPKPKKEAPRAERIEYASAGATRKRKG